MDRLISRPLGPPAPAPSPLILPGAAPAGPPQLLGPSGAPMPPMPPAGPAGAPPMSAGLPPEVAAMGLSPLTGPEDDMAMGLDPMTGGAAAQMAPPDPVAQAQALLPPPMMHGPMAAPSLRLPSEPMEFDDYLPLYPSWLYDRHGKVVVPRKPDRSRVESAISSDETKYQRLVDRLLEDLRYYRRKHKGVFEDLDPEDIEIIESAEIPTQVDKIANMLSGVATQVQWSWQTADEETQAQVMEDWARVFLRQIAYIHRVGGNTDLKWEQVWHALVYGRIVSRVMPDRADPTFPWDYKLYDPATVFPTFGGKKGLVRVSCVYQATLDEILNTYERPGEPLARQFTQRYKLEREGDLDLNVVGECREYWDPWYRWMEFDGVEVLPVTAHELGYVPFVYTLGPGEAGGTASPDRRRSGLTRREILAGYQGTGTDDAHDLANKGLSFFHHVKDLLKQEEALYGLLMVQAKQRINPPTNTESPYNGPAKPIDMRAGASNKSRPGEKVSPLLAGVQPADAGPLLAAFREQRVKGMLPDHMFGVQDESNISGFAMETMAAAAKDVTIPYISMLEEHTGDVLDMALREYRDFGFLFVPDASGGWPVPVQGRAFQGKETGASPPDAQMLSQLLTMLNGGMPPMPIPGAEAGPAFSTIAAGQQNPLPSRQHETPLLTRRLIMRMGTRPRVRLHKASTQELTQMMNVASMAIREKVWSRAHAMEELDVENPSAMWRQILAEDAKTNPKMLEMVEFPRQLWESGDTEGFLSYFATVIWPAILAGQQPMMPPGPGMDPSGGGGGGPETVQGQSQPMVGQGPGSPTGPGNANPMNGM